MPSLKRFCFSRCLQEERSKSEIRHLVSSRKNAPLSIRKQCELLQISRTQIYYKPQPESSENLKIMRLMDEHNIEHPDEGVQSMRNMLLDREMKVNHKRIRRLMKLMDIKAIYPQRNLTALTRGEYKYPYLLRNMEITHPNQVWSIDITYIAMARGFMYLTAIIDVYSRFIVGWSVGNSLDADVSLTVLKGAIARYGKPDIINSDQGSQYTSNLWVSYLTDPKQAIKISMDGKGRATDNIWIERFWRTIKRGYVYLHPAQDGIELHQGAARYIDYYNHRKRHSSLQRRVPAEVFGAQESGHGESSKQALPIPQKTTFTNFLQIN